MWKKIKRSKIFRGIVYFFPFQLLLLHIQRNQILLLFWIILTGYVTTRFASGYGVPYLFLNPEYNGNVNFLSYAILGFAYGGFVMAFNISSYIVNSHRFPFLATLSRPFLKYCLNNFLIPVAFFIIYCWATFRFLYYSEYLPWQTILKYLSGFALGTLLFISIAMGYFFTLAKDFIKIFGPDILKKKKKAPSRIQAVKYVINEDDTQIEKYDSIQEYPGVWRVTTYLRNIHSITLVRGTDHYDHAMLMKVFQQNHIIGALFEVIVFISLIFFGLFREIPAFKIPSAASILLLCTMLIMLSGAIHFIMRKWSTVFFIIAIVVIHFTSKDPRFNVINYAYGLDYENACVYNPDSLQRELINANAFSSDRIMHEGVLNNWKQKASAKKNSKPKFVIVTCSGGGLKAALWTFLALQQTDSLLQGNLMKHVGLITGSSGGMMGSAYFRELYIQQQQGIIDDLHNPIWSEKISQDILNHVSATIALNDLFLRLQSFKYGQYEYPKDRGYAFERQLNENTDYVLDKRVSDYAEYEKSGLAPMMILSPSIINDGKQLLISPLPLSFMSNNYPEPKSSNIPSFEYIEFNRLFKEQNAANLKFTSAIRMNATFPYILPSVTLPSKPAIEVMDAGMFDNLGVHLAMKYVYQMRKWFDQNTSGIVIMRIHDTKKDYEIDKEIRSGVLDNLTSPMSGIINNLNNIHVQQSDQEIQYLSSIMAQPIDVVDFRLADVIDKKQISMSLHLTSREKRYIRNAMQHARIYSSIQKLDNLLK